MNRKPINMSLEHSDASEQEVLAAAVRSREAVHRAWRRSVRRRRLVRATVTAAIILVAGILVSSWTDRGGPPALATVVESFGEVESGSDHLVPGGILRTGRESGVRLRLADGTDLRLDSESTIEWLGQPARSSLDRPAVRLSAGTLYFRSPPSQGEPLAIATPAGELINQGTEYELRVRPSSGSFSLELRVLEGSVRFRPARGEEVRVQAAEHLEVDSDGVAHIRPNAPNHLDWLHQLSRPFTVDGRTIEDFVRWVADERGLEIRWLIDEEARSTRMRGELIWRDPEAALGPTLRMAGLKARVSERLILIEARGDLESR